jgi:hypothetical protein
MPAMEPYGLGLTVSGRGAYRFTARAHLLMFTEIGCDNSDYVRGVGVEPEVFPYQEFRQITAVRVVRTPSSARMYMRRC